MPNLRRNRLRHGDILDLSEFLHHGGGGAEWQLLERTPDAVGKHHAVAVRAILAVRKDDRVHARTRMAGRNRQKQKKSTTGPVESRSS